MIDLNELSEKSFKINEKRKENGATVDKDILKHCSGELIEAVESREIWLSNILLNEYTHVDDVNYYKNNFADELADVINCILIESAKHNINIENALLKCIEKNRKRSEGNGDKP